MKKFDLSLFTEYIDNPKETSSYFNAAQVEVCNKNKAKVSYDTSWHNVHNFQSANVNVNTFVEKYITSYLKENEKVDRELLYKYFDKQKIDEWYTLARLAKGDSVTEIGNTVLDYNRLEALKNKR